MKSSIKITNDGNTIRATGSAANDIFKAMANPKRGGGYLRQPGLTMNDQISSLHACWCQVTGQDLNSRATERLFFEFAKMEFSVDDLQCVLKSMMAYNRKHPSCPMKVQAHKVLGDLEVFASQLAEARAIERNRVKAPTPRDAVLQSFRPTVASETGNGRERHVSEFIKIPST